MIRAPTTDADADESPAAPQSPIAAADIEDVVSRLTGLPRATVRADERAGLADLEARLAARVVRQPEAVAAVAGAVRRARFGLSESSRAAGAFLFAGPTGVGKTELARQLAAILGAPLLRFDMSEYMERHTVSRLLGAPPGYVGFEQSGLLTEAVTRRPHAVALFDEIEKAHPDIHNVLLQVMDNGALTDAAGRRADFRHAILIMTSNAGAQAWERAPLGFARGAAEADWNGMDELRRSFSPEFRNRLDAIVRFAPLPEAAMAEILELQLSDLSARLLAEKNIAARFGARLRRLLREEGFAPAQGARPLSRLLRETALNALAEAEASGALDGGGKFVIDYRDGKTVVVKQPARKPRKDGQK